MSVWQRLQLSNDASLDFTVPSDLSVPVSVFHSATVRFYAPSDLSGLGGMHTECIQSIPCWHKGQAHYDTVFLEHDPDILRVFRYWPDMLSLHTEMQELLDAAVVTVIQMQNEEINASLDDNSSNSLTNDWTDTLSDTSGSRSPMMISSLSPISLILSPGLMSINSDSTDMISITEVIAELYMQMLDAI
ncbi:hypothetical protein V8B97DRAFT_1919292 [Scleroderma yunnanense]